VAKNILVFADGTGNEGGLLPDESRTNVYKLYRATRTGPDSPIDPAEQVAFYIPGVGTPGTTPPSLWRRIWKGIEQSVGGGLTAQIVDCYAAIISVWRPGDRIYLFGFSRGAYTARCVAHLLEMVGIPTQTEGQPISLEPSSIRKLARSAVRCIYRLGLPQPDWSKAEQQAKNFIEAHKCSAGADHGATPYAICIWDAVAAIGWLHFAASSLTKKLPFIGKSYDMHFPPNVRFARHAMAIDEYRRDFERVPWGGSKTVPGGSFEGVTRFEQVWFAGNHSDIGGSYPENESRLSDITLRWMAGFIVNDLPPDARVLINRDLLHCYPSHDGMMHDELMVGHTKANIHFWTASERRVDPHGQLHPTVIERLRLPSVRNFIGYGPYRPASLREHPQAASFYSAPATSA
jgi:uncharacterized protein (DUF2235 family)